MRDRDTLRPSLQRTFMVGIPKLPLRGVLGAASLMLLAGLAMVIDASVEKAGGIAWWMAMAGLYVAALAGLWRKLRWAWHLSQPMAIFTMLSAIGWSLPTTDDHQRITPGHLFPTASTETIQVSIAVIALVTIAVLVALYRQRDLFRQAWW